MKAAILDSETGEVVNIIELPDDYDPEAEGAYVPSENFKMEVEKVDGAVIGATLVNGEWKLPIVEIPDPPVSPEPTLQEQLDALKDLLVQKGTLTRAQVDALTKR